MYHSTEPSADPVALSVRSPLRLALTHSLTHSLTTHPTQPPQPVPFEALIPFGLLTVMFAATGTLFSAAKRLTNDGKVSPAPQLQPSPPPPTQADVSFAAPARPVRPRHVGRQHDGARPPPDGQLARAVRKSALDLGLFRVADRSPPGPDSTLADGAIRAESIRDELNLADRESPEDVHLDCGVRGRELHFHSVTFCALPRARCAKAESGKVRGAANWWQRRAVSEDRRSPQRCGNWIG